MPSLDELREAREGLREIADERIRSEERLKQANEVLFKLGFDTVEESDKAIAKVSNRRKKLIEEVSEEYDEFMEQYAEIFE